MFDLDGFLASCQAANAESEPRLAMRDVLDRALTAPAEMADTLAPREGGITVLHHEPDLTVLHVVWAPGMEIFPHDHRMWAAIGIYAGQEDNTFYRREGSGLTESGGKRLELKDVALLGDDTIHSVSNPGRQLTGAIHVYGGDLMAEPRSQWGPGPLEERPYDIDLARRQFAEANATWEASRA